MVTGTDFGKAARDYGTFRAGFPDSFFQRLLPLGVGLKHQTLVDLGTGTGTLARGFALRGCNVIGIDLDSQMLEQAQILDRQANVSVRYLNASAEATGLDAQQADVITAGQCWHWFDQEGAIAETLRLLKPHGKLVIAHFDWLPLAGNVVEATERLIEQHNPDWHLGGGLGLHPEWLPGLGEAGFCNLETFSYDVDVPYTPEAWRGRIRASAGITALEPEAVQTFDAALSHLLASQWPSEVLQVPHRVFAIIADRPTAIA